MQMSMHRSWTRRSNEPRKLGHVVGPDSRHGGKMFMFGDDMLMLYGAIFPRYTNVSNSTRR
jgi:hypothetical protein